MAYLLDTSVAIPLRDGDDELRAKLRSLSGSVAISVVTRVELEGGVYTDPSNAAVRRLRLDQMLAGIRTLSFNEEDAIAYGQIVANVGHSRRKVIDRMIAAQAIVHRATLVTRNPDDFAGIPKLSLQTL